MALTKDDLSQIDKLLRKQRKEINNDTGDVIDKIVQRIDGLEDTMERRFDAVDERLDKHYNLLTNHNWRIKG